MARNNQAMTDLLRYNSALLPQRRTSFNKSHSHATTLDSAYLVPLMWDRVLPGDEKKIRYSGLARMATPIHPVMDEANLDVWAFFVPDRLWYADAKKFYGENLDASFNPDGEYEMPSLPVTELCIQTDLKESSLNIYSGIHSLSDYFGFPHLRNMSAGIPNSTIRATVGLHRSYQIIWNEYYRNSSIQSALQLNDGPTVSVGEAKIIKQIRKVCKYPDFFTSLLRTPQAGDDVYLPLGDWAPVVTRGERVTWEEDNFMPLGMSNAQLNRYGGNLGLWSDGFLHVDADNSAPVSGKEVAPDNLWANLTNATAVTINNLRSAVTIQHLLELDAIGGKRYQNIIQAHFGVLTPDATLQRPELLGATRTPIGMRQVIQTSETTRNGTPQGNTAAFSLTNVANEWICNKAFTEPGFIMVLGAIRPVHSYSQGVNPLLTKLHRYDNYWPVFDNIGNQPVPNSAIYFGNEAADRDVENDTFGYQEAWTEYRVMQNRVSGLMRPDVAGTLASWNYSSYFDTTPVLNSEFVSEDPSLIDRVIATPDEPQFILDSYFDYIDVKNMSAHSVPGLLRL